MEGIEGGREFTLTSHKTGIKGHTHCYLPDSCESYIKADIANRDPSCRTKTNHSQPSLFIWYDRGNISGNSSEPKLYLCNKHLMHNNNVLDY